MSVGRCEVAGADAASVGRGHPAVRAHAQVRGVRAREQVLHQPRQHHRRLLPH